MECPNFDFEIRLPIATNPQDVFDLFSIYYTPEIIELIAKYMNLSLRKAKDPSLERSRANAWYPTYVKEIYTFFAIRIYMMIYPLNQILDY
jgi:hypothetical protein